MGRTKVKTVHQDLGDIQISTLINPNTGLDTVCIFQSNKTIFLEHSKIVEFLKTVNNFK